MTLFSLKHCLLTAVMVHTRTTHLPLAVRPELVQATLGQRVTTQSMHSSLTAVMMWCGQRQEVVIVFGSGMSTLLVSKVREEHPDRIMDLFRRLLWITVRLSKCLTVSETHTRPRKRRGSISGLPIKVVVFHMIF